jgi:glycosyltransferase involved in cell wall biosynthesis
MKILVIAKWFVKWNGASRVVYELSKKFKEKHDVMIIAYEDYIDAKWEKEFKICKLRHKGLFALNEIREIIKCYKPDIIHSHDWIGLMTLVSGVPQVATTHSNWPKNWFLDINYFVAGIIQGIPHWIKLCMVRTISVSNYQQRILNNQGIKSDVIYNGIGEEYFSRPENCIELEHPSILFVGSIDTGKAEYLAPFIEKLSKKRRNIHIYIIGASKSRKIIKRLRNIKNVHFLGIINDVKPYYHAVDIMISTSKAEVFGLVLAEAQACGLPVVAFDVCSNEEIIKDKSTGFLVRLGNLEDMVDKVISLLDNEDARKKMGELGIKNIGDNFLWDDKAKEYIRIFERIINNNI